jgi:hypothetical protein
MAFLSGYSTFLPNLKDASSFLADWNVFALKHGVLHSSRHDDLPTRSTNHNQQVWLHARGESMTVTPSAMQVCDQRPTMIASSGTCVMHRAAKEKYKAVAMLHLTYF